MKGKPYPKNSLEEKKVRELGEGQSDLSPLRLEPAGERDSGVSGSTASGGTGDVDLVIGIDRAAGDSEQGDGVNRAGDAVDYHRGGVDLLVAESRAGGSDGEARCTAEGNPAAQLRTEVDREGDQGFGW